MKKLLLLLALGFSLVASAQTNTNSAPVISGPAADAWQFITTEGSTNWFVVPFATYDTTMKEFGGGVALGYKLSQFVAPVMRFDYLADQAYTVQANMQLQIPVKIMGKIDVIPFTFAGVGTSIAGAHEHNGEAIGILGIGGAIKLSKKFDVVGDYEYWTGAQFTGNNQVRFGFLYKF